MNVYITLNSSSIHKKDPLMVYSSTPKRRRSPARLAAYVLGLGALVYGASLLFGGTPPAAFTPPPPAVVVQVAEQRDLPLVFEYPARLAGSREVEIRARVGGILLKRAYTEGQYIKRGDLLFQIDPAPYEAALAQAKANFTQAERDYQRASGLLRQKALSPREFDEAKAVYGSTKAALETAKINLAYTTVRAPISGYTSEEAQSEGSLVVADNTLLTRVTQLDPMYVEFAYPDSEALLQRRSVSEGSIRLPEDKLLHVEVVFKDGTSYPKEGTIRFTDSIVNADTGTVRARAILDNAEQEVLPGQFVRVRVKGMTQVQAIGVPERAIMQGPMGTFVYTIDAEGKAAISPVELGLLNNGVQIVAKGLNPGDKVIIEGMIKTRPGAPVCIDSEASPCGPKAPPAAASPAAEKPKG